MQMTNDGEIGHTNDDDPTPIMFGNYVSSQSGTQKWDSMVSMKVMARKWDYKGQPIGRDHSNPILDTQVYELSGVC